MAELKVEQWAIDRLTPYARNPRKNEHAVPKMASLIKEFGFKVPVVARSDGSVVDGHLRLMAARHLGMETVPVELIENALLNSSVEGDVVMDLFGGSGSTLIACEKMRRVCRMMELSPRYVDVIVRRWQDFTGQEATLEEDGRTFAQVKEERGG